MLLGDADCLRVAARHVPDAELVGLPGPEVVRLRLQCAGSLARENCSSHGARDRFGNQTLGFKAVRTARAESLAPKVDAACVLYDLGSNPAWSADAVDASAQQITAVRRGMCRICPL